MDTIVSDAIEPVARSFAAQSCADQALQFDVVFRRHFLISQQPIRASETWVSHTGAAIHISHCPDLPVVQLRDRRNETLGWVLGIAVTGSGAYLDETEASDLSNDPRDTPSAIWLQASASPAELCDPDTCARAQGCALCVARIEATRGPIETGRTDRPTVAVSGQPLSHEVRGCVLKQHL